MDRNQLTSLSTNRALMDLSLVFLLPGEAGAFSPCLPIISRALQRDSSPLASHLSFEGHLPLTELLGPEYPSSAGKPPPRGLCHFLEGKAVVGRFGDVLDP